MVKTKILRRLFSREAEEECVPILELKEWLDAYADEEFSKRNDELEHKLADLKKLMEQTRKDILVLKDARLANQDIPPREKFMMEGNRSSFIKKTHYFLQSLALPEQDYEEIARFTHQFEEKLQEHEEATNKAYFVLKNFLDKEMTAIARDLKNLETLILKLREIVEGEGIRKIKNLYTHVRKLNEKSIRNDRIHAKIKETKKKIQQNTLAKSSLEGKMQVLENSKNYARFHELNRQKQHIEGRIKAIEQDLSNFFIVIDRALKKFQHSKGAEIIKKYQDDPTQALREDTSLKIKEFLRELCTGLEKGEIKIKSKKKILKKIAELDFKAYRDQLSDLEKERSRLNSHIEKNTIMMDYKELEYQIEHITNKIEEYKNYLESLIQEQKTINMEKEIYLLENKFIKLTGRKVIIT